MLPVAYRVIKGFATFFGVIGVISCVGGIIGGIIANDELKKNKTQGLSQPPVADNQVQAIPQPALQAQKERLPQVP
ncbi:hypothetical protein A6V39_03030 [Candidatus Mycoplasma haematobovis]|uniref:Uncharacterized protein n=1 Tax=Candidatus Mycoplasma haematobovis TaxID=432608 RepID=A0A1A9QE39_9MOLU|nr:hypothetical protein [Candidatus Mycoplasma haematobovis]OAL10384.1 hypothetical protein A6V39_03030 [Candidatus Mycoplasma haematobovis]